MGVVPLLGFGLHLNRGYVPFAWGEQKGGEPCARTFLEPPFYFWTWVLLHPLPLLGQIAASLRGLDSIYVSVGFDGDAEAMSLSLEDVRTKVKLELRRAGVAVATEEALVGAAPRNH